MIGRTISHYKVLERLGGGGMGVIYKAEDTRLGRLVALKFLSASLAEDPEALERFQREARAASALDNPYICTVFDVGEHEGQPFLVMELMQGKTLEDRIENESLPTERVIEIGFQVADALVASHAAGIVHRDVKPANIFVTEHGEAKVLDFGLAKLRPLGESAELSRMATEAMTRQGAVLGTYPYMSPEQVEGRAVDARSDIFSLGVMLHEMATGERPFRGETSASLVAAILKETPPRVDEVRAELPHHLGRIIRRCLEKDPERRFQSARDLRNELEDLQCEVAAGRAAISGGPPASKAVRRAWWRRFPTVAAALALAVLAGVYAWRSQRSALPAAVHGIASLAVLPLENLSGDPEQEYFADGMTEALITDLAKIRALKVISRSSVMQYKEARKPLPEIAGELDVDGLITGAVLRAGDRVRITAQLVDPETEEHLWADRYERDLRDVLSLQSEVVEAIAREIQVALTPHEEARLTRSRAVDPEAHEAFLRGYYHLNKRTAAGLSQAVDYFQLAIDADAGYARAHAALALSYILLGNWGALPPNEVFPRAKAAAQRALELDDLLAESHGALGSVYFSYERNWSRAETEYRRAIELNPSYAQAHSSLAYWLSLMGRHEEAILEQKKARELDPLSVSMNLMVGMMIYRARRYDEAIDEYRKTVAMDPNYAPAHWYLGWAYLRSGMDEEAIAEVQKGLDLAPGDPSGRFFLACGLAVAGRRAEARELLDALKEVWERERLLAGFVAVVHSALGEKEEAFAWLDKAYDTYDAVLFQLDDPAFDSLRSDPRFHDLLRRMNLPAEAQSRLRSAAPSTVAP